jgi:acyl-homoserine lactone acylase PvdQ
VARHGLVIATDSERRLSFALRWSGTEPGAAAELASLAVDRARSWRGFREALSRWKMPVRRMMFADVDGNVGFQDAGIVPVRRGAEWIGWRTLDTLPHAFNTRSRSVGSTESAPAMADTESRAQFVHPLAVTAAARQRFDVEVKRPVPNDSPVRADFDLRDWDRSRAINAPGQSAYADSPHFRDLATLWSEGRWIELPFSEAAVQRHAQSTLMLVPGR